MKKLLTLLVSIMVICLLLPISTMAYPCEFGGTIRYEISDVSSPEYGDGNNVTNVNWNYSSDGGKFNVWFSVWGADGEIGRTLFYGHTNGTVNLKRTTSSSKKYNLAANREHYGNPQIFISGTWKP